MRGKGPSTQALIAMANLLYVERSLKLFGNVILNGDVKK